MGKFCLTFLDQEGTKFTSVNGWITKSSDEVGDASNVVEVSVGYHYGTDPILTIFKIFCIWQDVVNTWCVIVGKLDTSIDNYNILAELYDRHILADLFYATEWNNSNTVS